MILDPSRVTRIVGVFSRIEGKGVFFKKNEKSYLAFQPRRSYVDKELNYPHRPFWITVKEYLKDSSLQSRGDGISY